MNLQITDNNFPPVENNKIKSKVAFMQFMGREYSCLDEDQVSHLVMGFFQQIKKGKTTEKFDNKFKELHPINQQALFKKGIEIAQSWSKNKNVENLHQKLRELEVQNDLTSNDEPPVFNSSYISTPRLKFNLISIFFLAIGCSIAYVHGNDFSKLRNQLKNSNGEIRILRGELQDRDEANKECQKDYNSLFATSTKLADEHAKLTKNFKIQGDQLQSSRSSLEIESQNYDGLAKMYDRLKKDNANLYEDWNLCEESRSSLKDNLTKLKEDHDELTETHKAQTESYNKYLEEEEQAAKIKSKYDRLGLA